MKRKIISILMTALIMIVIPTQVYAFPIHKTEKVKLPSNNQEVIKETRSEVEAKIKTEVCKDTESINVLARLVYNEARGTTKVQQAAVVWCVLNRIDNSNFPDTVKEVVTQKNQFAYSSGTPLQNQFQEVASDVMVRWKMEKKGYNNVGRVLPSDYKYFSAGGNNGNKFRKDYSSRSYWNWTLENPYK